MKILKKLFAVSRGFRSQILISAGLGILSIGLSFGFIWYSKMLIDIATGSSREDFVRTAVITASLLVIQLLVQAVNHRLSIGLQGRMTNALRGGLFHTLMYSKWNEAERFATGDLMTRIMQDNAEMVRLMVSSVPRICTTAVELTAAFVFLYFLNAGLAVSILLITPVFLFLSKAYLKKMRSLSKEIKKSESCVNSLMQESFSHRMVLKTLEYIPNQIENLSSLQGSLLAQIMRRGNLTVFSGTAVSLGFAVGYLTAFIWGSVQIRNGAITFGTMTAFLQLANKIQSPALELIRIVPSLISTWTAAERVIELESLGQEKRGQKEMLAGALTLKMENINFSYHPDKQVLHNLQMIFEPHTMTAITGETGVGKTTLLRLMLGLVSPQNGEILLSNGREEKTVSPLTRSNFIYVPQGNTLFGTSIRNNLLMGNPSASQSDLEEALFTAAADFVSDLPEGIDTILGERGAGLSEGQAQRIAIARALLRPGGIIVMDEPTSALDTATEQLFLNRLKTKMASRTIIFITHHPSLANVCDKVYHLE